MARATTSAVMVMLLNLETAWKDSIEQEIAEAQRRKILWFDGGSWLSSFQLRSDGCSAPLRSPVKSAFPVHFLDLPDVVI